MALPPKYSDLNFDEPRIMHVDLNSCFAIIEQQANPLIRHKPVAIAAYDTPRGAIIASSYEAKALGIMLGVNVGEARMLSREVIVMMPDPEKYFDAHRRFKRLLMKYTDAVTPKSIDEFQIDFTGSPAVRSGQSLVDIACQIKEDVRCEVGDYVTINVGIATNRFLSKVAAGLHKPDGLDVVVGEDIRNLYSRLDLIDLPGINKRFKVRLNLAGIYTPLQFLDADVLKLYKGVFKSVEGIKWFLRLRGHEVDDKIFGHHSFGQQYALGDNTTDKEKLARLIIKLSVKAGSRMRKLDYVAQGVHLWMSFENHMYWAKGKKTHARVYSDQDIFRFAQILLNEAPIPARVTNIGMTAYDLIHGAHRQVGLFDDSRLDSTSLAEASDLINNRYGDFTLVPATMANMKDVILKRVAFGSVRDL
jgi:DNA polymerase-4